MGPAVSRHQVGDLVGIGCMVNSCLTCENCQADQEQYSLKGNTLVFGAPAPAEPGAHTQGGYSEAIVAPEDFVVRVPETLDPAADAPLLCAGITGYPPKREGHWSTRVGATPAKRSAAALNSQRHGTARRFDRPCIRRRPPRSPSTSQARPSLRARVARTRRTPAPAAR
ncbi:alcohol dehydrogenase catalytic domain-containing protein [Streptomyces griseiscabiei]|uniref:alcohol dehydrogenase catalytic domain-containing protein n=1 Tax=Streptomyces griseiscabiei TaxID=2993540 RepID=UPI0029E7E7F6|nr:alcohol dehydrogenase catalytic domain-containing protein [Streptomyces griseiscabiei]